MHRLFLVIIFLKLVFAASDGLATSLSVGGASNGGNATEMSDFRRRKLATFLSVADANHDGIVEEVDYHLLADRFLTACHWNIDENKIHEIHRTTVGKAWKSFPYDKDGKGKSVTHDEFWAVMQTRVKDPKYKGSFKNFAQIVFTTFDVDQDNLLSLVEFSAILHEWRGIDSSTTKPYFDGIDTNHDGVLSFNEYLAASVDFFTGEDETSPSQFILGPLV